MNKQLRIIAGKFRGRKIFFDDQNLELRPTLGRVRETVFNWLTPYIVGANCLDLFAGSAIFGFEAKSRGASSIVSVEYNYDTYNNILKNQLKLNISDQEFKIINQDVLLFLNNFNNLKNNNFNIIFLDPPYKADQELLLTSLKLLVNNNFLTNNCKLYFESDKKQDIFQDQLNTLGLHLHKTSKAGQVYFYLYEFKF